MESKGLILAFNHPKYFLADSLVFFFFFLATKVLHPRKMLLSFPPGYSDILFLELNTILLNLSPCPGPCPHVHFLLK